MTNKAYSNLKIVWHPEKLQSLKCGEVTAPLYVRIKPTNRCNQRCFYCSYADTDLNLRKKVVGADELEWALLERTLNEFDDIGVKAVTFSGGGEPLLYPRIKDALQCVSRSSIDLSLITNGVLLSEEIAEYLVEAKWVRVSADSADAARYSKNRNVPQEQFISLIDNLSHFANIKSNKCELGINFVVNHNNNDEIYSAARFFRDLGVNHIKFTARVTSDIDEYHSDFKKRVIEAIVKAKIDLETNDFRIIDKYEGDFDLSLKSKRVYKKCHVMQILSVIAADANVYLCHDKAYVKNGILGSLKEKSYKDLWFSQETKHFFETFNPQKECCHHCVFDERNLLIADILDSSGQHVNFI